MRKLLLIFFCLLSVNGAELGVLYNDTNNNTISPSRLRIGSFEIITNLTLVTGKTPSRALVVDGSTNVVSTDLTSTQVGQLAILVGGTNLINLGASRLLSGAGNPTNGVMETNRTLYINTSSAAVNDSLWVNFDTNWYRVASTNGGAITEAQLNFSDVTTADSTTNQHGLAMKLSGTTNTWYSGIGTWSNPLTTQISGLIDGRILEVDLTLPGGPGLNQTTLAYNNLANSVILEGAGFGLNGQFRAYSVYATNDFQGPGTNAFGLVKITGIPASSLLRTTSGSDVTNVTIGSGLTFDGTTLSATGAGTNFVSISGTPAANQVTYWTGPTTITGNTNLTFDGTTTTAITLNSTTATLANITNVSNISLSLTNGIGATNGNIFSSEYVPTRTAVANCSFTGTTQHTIRYTRLGNVVAVSGMVEYNKVVSSTVVRFRLSLPVTPVSGTLSFTDTLTGTVVAMHPTLLQPLAYGQIISFQSPEEAHFILSGDSSSGVLRQATFNFSYIVN